MKDRLDNGRAAAAGLLQQPIVIEGAEGNAIVVLNVINPTRIIIKSVMEIVTADDATGPALDHYSIVAKIAPYPSHAANVDGASVGQERTARVPQAAACPLKHRTGKIQRGWRLGINHSVINQHGSAARTGQCALNLRGVVRDAECQRRPAANDERSVGKVTAAGTIEHQRATVHLHRGAVILKIGVNKRQARPGGFLEQAIIPNGIHAVFGDAGIALNIEPAPGLVIKMTSTTFTGQRAIIGQINNALIAHIGLKNWRVGEIENADIGNRTAPEFPA